MNRRTFFASLFGAATTALAIDPEKLLWEPGKKLISIPKPVALAPTTRPSMTARMVIDSAMRQIGVLGPGEQPCAADLEYALTRFNAMLDGWKVERFEKGHLDAAIYGLAGRIAPMYSLWPDDRAERWVSMGEQLMDRQRAHEMKISQVRQPPAFHPEFHPDSFHLIWPRL